MKHNENLTKISLETLNKYVGEKNIKRVIQQMTSDLNKVLNKYLVENTVIEEDFPIEFENELGKFIIDENGNTLYQPKIVVQHITVDINLNKDETDTF